MKTIVILQVEWDTCPDLNDTEQVKWLANLEEELAENAAHEVLQNFGPTAEQCGFPGPYVKSVESSAFMEMTGSIRMTPGRHPHSYVTEKIVDRTVVGRDWSET